MNERQLAEELKGQGFPRTYAWEDGPGVVYPEHTHVMATAHIILSGEMTLTMNGHSQTYRAGECCNVPAGAVHSPRMGPEGCRYLIGEK